MTSEAPTACDEDGCDESAIYYDMDSQWCGSHADEREARTYYGASASEVFGEGPRDDDA